VASSSRDIRILRFKVIQNTYTDTSYQRQGVRVWIHATRYSALQQYSSP
jgi:hypothetical protein